MHTIGREAVGEERSDTELVLAARDDDPGAFGELFERWFDRSWNVARTILRDDDLAADVAQDTMVKAWQQLDQLRDPDAFGGWLLRSTRNRALNRLAREGRSRATGDDVVSGLRDRGGNDPVGAERQPEPDQVSEIRDRQDLVWAAATALGERDVSLLDLHLRHGLTPAEIADELGVEANAAHQQLFRLRGRLGDAIGSFLLWRNGRPLCDGLAEAVSGRTAFDRSVAKAVARHQASCEHCSEERDSMVDPSKLFAAVPLLLVPPHLKASAAAALQSVGVPTDGSATSFDAGSGDGGSSQSGTSADPGSGSSGPGDPGTGADPGSGTGGSGSGGSGGSGTGGSGSGGSEGSTGSGSASGGTAGSPADGIRLDLAGAPAPPPAPVAAAPGAPLANEIAGSGPSILAPTLALTRGRAMALAGVGVTAIVALIALGALVLRDRGPGDGVAAIASDAPDPLAPAQQDGGEEAGSGPASFSPSSESSSSSSSASSSTTGTTNRSTTEPERSSTSAADRSTTETTAPTTESTPTTGTTSTTETPPSTSGTTTSTTQRFSTTTTTTTDRDTTSSSRDTTTSTSSDPDTTPSTGTTPPTPPPVDPPIVVRFTSRVSRTSLQCLRNQRTYDAIWFTEFADTVTLSLPGSSPRVGASGTFQFCGTAGDRIGITARNSGGEDKASTTL